MTTITNEVGRLTRTEREVRNAAAVAGAILGALLGSPAGLSGGVTGALLFGAFGFAGGIVAEREARRAASKRF
ncbi:MAG TPA: hypothetical protein VM580_27330, partial [Labilithrix sp.]|nr:hypothetical protein [Labilithrix sp.]